MVLESYQNYFNPWVWIRLGAEDSTRLDYGLFAWADLVG
jgi:hypothetical protein